jgi:hypothetical protein
MAALFFVTLWLPHTVQNVVPPYVTSRHNEDNIYIWKYLFGLSSIFQRNDKGGREGTYTSFTIGVQTGITLERQRRREGTYILVLLVVYGQGKEDHEPAVGLLRDVMVCVVLNHSTRGRMIIWARREGGRDSERYYYYGATPIWNCRKERSTRYTLAEHFT